MLPLKDDVPSRSVPFVTIGLIAANTIVFFYQVSLQMSGDAGALRAAQEFIFEFGAIPCRIAGACVQPDRPQTMLTVLTSMFVHGGLFHVGGNMLYLWIFGDNVEDTLGHLRFLGFYLASGAAAAVAQTVVNPTSAIPMVGASGAVSGVLGAYLLLFPYASVWTLVTFGFFIRFVQLPAILVLGFWIVVQLFSGYVTWGSALGEGSGGGVAWFAHIGGFLAGMLLLFVLRARRRRRL
jgi:membrane associated rhomboid family serine protease